MTLSSSGLAAGFQNTPVLTFHPGPIMKQFLIVSRLFVKKGEGAQGLGTDTAAQPAASRYPSRRGENTRRVKRQSLLPPLLCWEEWMESTAETPAHSGKPCISLVWRSDTHLLKELSLLKQCKSHRENIIRPGE